MLPILANLAEVAREVRELPRPYAASQDGTVPGRECSAETGVGSSLVFCKDCSRLRSQSQAFGLFVFEARMSNLTKTERMKDIQENVLT